jgi:hypothetical protein
MRAALEEYSCFLLNASTHPLETQITPALFGCTIKRQSVQFVAPRPRPSVVPQSAHRLVHRNGGWFDLRPGCRTR